MKELRCDILVADGGTGGVAAALAAAEAGRSVILTEETIRAMLAPHVASGRLRVLTRCRPIAASTQGDRVQSVTFRHLPSGNEQSVTNLLPACKNWVSRTSPMAATGCTPWGGTSAKRRESWRLTDCSRTRQRQRFGSQKRRPRNFRRG